MTTQPPSKPLTPRGPEQTTYTKFWIVSITLHIAVLALLVWMIPAETMSFEEATKKKKVMRKDDKLERVVEQIRDIEADKLRARLDLLAGGTDRMRVNVINFQGRHKGFSNAQKSVAFKRIREQLALAKRLVAERQTQHATYKVTFTSEDDAYAIPVKNIKIRSIIEDIEAAVPLLPEGEGQELLGRMVKSALGLHFEATRHCGWMMGIDGGFRKANDPVYTGLDECTAAVFALDGQGKVAEQLEIIKTANGVVSEALQAQQAKVKAVNAEMKGKKYKDKEEREEWREKLKAEKAIEAGLKQDKRRHDRFRLSIQTGDFIRKTADALQWAENAVNEKFDEAAFAETLAEQDDDEPFTLVTKPDVPSAPRSELIKQDVVDLFDTSDRLITQLTIDYRTIKAIQLAELRDISVDIALDQIQKVAPLPTEVDKILLRESIRDPDLFEQHKQELEKVKASVEEKISLAERLLLEIEAMEVQHAAAQEEMDPKTLEDILATKVYDEDATLEPEAYQEQREAKTQEMNELMELAQVDERDKHKDLAEQMKKVMDVQDLTQEMKESEAGEMALPTLAKDGSDPRTSGTRLTPQTDGALSRKFAKDGIVGTEWMFVDTWYTIGPFPNEMRRNIHTKFPPETVIDLDARYAGKGGAAVAWEFIQSRENKVVPAHPDQYAIYYAYTEVYMEEACDLWIAVGSDDKANVWINDMPVWISGDALKGWNISEGYRKVHFKQGKNKVLYRIENGWLGVAFSLSIYTKL